MANLQIIDYTEKAVIVVGDTYEIKDQLKANGGKFSRSWKCGPGWMFPKSKINAIEAILKGFDGVDVANIKKGQKVAEKANKTGITGATNKELPSYFLTKEEIREFWINEGETNEGLKMLDYYCKNYPLAVRLNDGRVIFCERSGIETNFCFGYGYNGMYDEESYNDAIDAQRAARNDENYFIRENMAGIRAKVARAKGEEHPGYGVGGSEYCYTLQRERDGSKVVELYFFDVSKETLKKMDFCLHHLTQAQIDRLQPIEGEDRQRIVKLYETEEAHRLKRVQTYLKKYGLSKLRTWTYLSD